jgi:hypothetical protein
VRKRAQKTINKKTIIITAFFDYFSCEIVNTVASGLCTFRTSGNEWRGGGDVDRDFV